MPSPAGGEALPRIEEQVRQRHTVGQVSAHHAPEVERDAADPRAPSRLEAPPNRIREAWDEAPHPDPDDTALRLGGDGLAPGNRTADHPEHDRAPHAAPANPERHASSRPAPQELEREVEA